MPIVSRLCKKLVKTGHQLQHNCHLLSSVNVFTRFSKCCPSRLRNIIHKLLLCVGLLSVNSAWVYSAVNFLQEILFLGISKSCSSETMLNGCTCCSNGEIGFTVGFGTVCLLQLNPKHQI